MDPRTSFICATVAGAIAPPDQKEQYLQFLAQDANGAIAAFLNDGSIMALQVRSDLGSMRRMHVCMHQPTVPGLLPCPAPDCRPAYAWPPPPALTPSLSRPPTDHRPAYAWPPPLP